MAFFTAASKADFQHQLQAALAQYVSEQALPQVALFAEQFFGIIALEELTLASAVRPGRLHPVVLAHSGTLRP